MRTDRELLKTAFLRLQGKGFFAGMNFMCCQSCASAEIHNDHADRQAYVFWHEQDEESFEGDDLTNRLHLGYGVLAGKELTTEAVGRLIVDELEKVSLKVDWNGSSDTRIAVLPRA